MVINGNIDKCGEGRLQGWVVCRDALEERLRLDVMYGEQLIGHCRADVYREDLATAGIGDGRYGFSFELPSELSASALRSIRLRLSDTSVFMLQNFTQPEDNDRMLVFQYLSRFGGLWIDRLDWIDQLGRRTRSGELSDAIGQRIMSFVRDGYLVVPGAVDAAAVAALNAGIAAQWNSPAPGLMMRADSYDANEILEQAMPTGREAGSVLVDPHLVLPELRAALSAPPVLEFLAAIFGQTPALVSSAAQYCSASRPTIQDSILTGSDSPLEMATAWLSLGDTAPGDGSSTLLTGSHRVRDFLFSGIGKGLRDGPDQLRAYTASMVKAAAGANYIPYTPQLRAGDIVIRHADLLYGAAPVSGTPAMRSATGVFLPSSLVSVVAE